MIKQCAFCGTKFNAIGSSMYCSTKCRNAAYYDRYKKKQEARPSLGTAVCQYCGKEFDKKHERQRYCNQECAQAEVRRRNMVAAKARRAQKENSAPQRSETLCWHCARVSDRSCSWSENFTPVKGWTAKPSKKAGYTTYKVLTCPLFKRG